jgi:hypothetical protein
MHRLGGKSLESIALPPRVYYFRTVNRSVMLGRRESLIDEARNSLSRKRFLNGEKLFGVDRAMKKEFQLQLNLPHSTKIPAMSLARSSSK